MSEAAAWVVGHGRLEALRALQAAGESPPAGVASADGDWLVPVVRGVRFANPKAAEAYLLADNRLSELGGWDDAELLEVLRDMQGADLLEATGFGSSDITELLRALDPPPRPGADDVPERVAKRTRPGDLWLCGDHRLECVDATQGGGLARLLDGQAADVMLTDPPYNVDYTGAAGAMEGDAQDAGAFDVFLRAAFSNAAAAMRPGAAAYVFHPDSGGLEFRSAFVDAGFALKQVLVWVKDRFVLSRQDYNWQHEPILYGWKPGAAHSWFGLFDGSTVIDDARDIATMRKAELVEALQRIKDEATVLRADRPTASPLHPTMKPVALCARLLGNSAAPGELVLDPFGGSGSTLIAAEQLGMRAALAEIDPYYCDVIVTRWEQLVGGKAKRSR
jgi:DNA modification methylase